MVLLFAAVLIPRSATAEGSPRAEFGTCIGLTIIDPPGGGASNTHLGIPGGIGPLSPASPIVYASFFVTPSTFIEPQVSLNTVSGGGTTTIFSLVGHVGYLFAAEESASPYVSVGGAYQGASGGGSFGGPALGGEVGFRFRVGTGLAMRLKAQYRRWFSDFAEANELGFGVGVGGLL